MLVGGLGGAKIVILQLEQSQRSMFRKIITLQVR